MKYLSDIVDQYYSSCVVTYTIMYLAPCGYSYPMSGTYTTYSFHFITDTTCNAVIQLSFDHIHVPTYVFAVPFLNSFYKL